MGTWVQYFMIFVQIVVGFMLIGIILLQKSKSQGMGTAFGGGMGESLFGSQVGNVLTKVTVVLAFVFLLNSTLLAFMKSGGRTADVSVTDRVKDIAPPPVDPTMPQPQQDAHPGPVWDRAVDTGLDVQPPAADVTADVRRVDTPVPDVPENAQPDIPPSDLSEEDTQASD